ncbi:MAG: TonB-dependent receptor [Parasphingorhabdus sp.]|nr:TonB-dependent receptor [Parasphingorhabdus sp.]
MSTKKIALTALLCSTMFATPAFAQEDQVAQDDSAVDESIIIVTAQRRAQDVQDIPVAVTAVSPIQLERQGVVNVQQISNVAASFSSSNAQLASGSVVLRIRGVGTTSNNIGFESAVGIFIDGAYQSRPGIALSEFVDVERVEVLRGPQGTLFGRNTSAGALTITNKRPDLNEFGGFVNATYGNYDHISVQGAVNVPLVQDTLAARVTGAYRKRDGFIDVLGPGGTKIGESNGADQYLVRGQLGFESPGGITARLIGDYSQSTAGCCSPLEILKSPVEVFGLFNAVGLGPTGGMFGPSRATSSTDTTTAQGAVDGLTASANIAPITNVKQWGVTGEVNVPLGDFADAIYIGSYRKFKSFEKYDTDFSALDVFNVDGNDTRIDTMTHELRVQGEALGDKLNWMVGGYYSTEDIAQNVSFSLGQDYGEFVGALFFGPTAGALGANPLTIFSGGVDPAGTLATNRYIQNSKSWSIFTHNTLEIIDNLEVSVGLRYSDESKDGSYTQTASNNPLCRGIVQNIGGVPAALRNNVLVLGCLPFLAPADLPQATAPGLPSFFLPRTFSGKFSDTELIYTGKLAYAFAAPVNIYASFTHGYKSGGFNLDSTAAIGGADPRFASEEVNAYEIGLKAKALNNALTFNLAAFVENFTNFQVLEFTGTRFQTFNVPKADSKGVELEMTVRPDDHLTLNAAVTVLDAKYPKDCAGTQTAVNVVNLCGIPLTNASDVTGIVGATYAADMGGTLKGFVNAQVRLESDSRTSTQRFDPAITTSKVLVPFDEQDGNIKVNLRAGVGDRDDAWGIEAWVTNLTNVVTRGVTFNTTLRSGSRSTFPLEPRMYGLTLRGSF